MLFEFIISRRPISSQTKSRSHLQEYKQYVQAEAARAWKGTVLAGTAVHATIVYLFHDDPIDTDNIVKPILDALVGLVYEDDLDVTDVEAHRRPLTEKYDEARLPAMLLQAVQSNGDCVYVRVAAAEELEDYL